MKRAGSVLKKGGRKKRKAVKSKAVEQDEEPEYEAKKVGEKLEEHVPDAEFKEKMLALIVVSKMSEPGVVDDFPLGVKHPIINVSYGIHGGSEAYWDIKRTNGKNYRFLSFLQMLQYFDRDDVDTL